MTTTAWLGIETRGRGLDSLRKYLKLFGTTPPASLQTGPKDWEPEEFEIPHGFLEVWAAGTWKATFVLNSVMADIQTVPGVEANFYKEGGGSNTRTPLIL